MTETTAEQTLAPPAAQHPLIEIIGNERRFCGWGGTKGTAPKKPKAPATAQGELMKWGDSAHWMTYAEVQTAMQRGTVKGAGYFTSNGDHPELTPITVIDLDSCVQGGVVVGNWQRDVVDAANTLTVVSPSGTGLHLIFLAASEFTAPEIVAVKGDELRGYECFSKAHHVRLGSTVLRDVEPGLLTREVWDKIAPLLPGWLDEQAAAMASRTLQPLPAITPKHNATSTNTRSLSAAQVGFVAGKFNELHDVGAILAKHGYTVATKAHDSRVDVTRAGKDAREGASGNIKSGVYYPFSSNDQLEAHKPYTAFGAWCKLEHAGDEQVAAGAAAELLRLELGRKAQSPQTDAATLDGTDMAKRGKGSKAIDRPTDDDLAERWNKRYPDTAYGVGEFRRYTNGFWGEVEKRNAEREILDVIREAKPEGIKPNSGILASVEKLASVMVGVSDRKWDCDPDLLVCANGTLHIPTLELRDHSLAHYLTSGLPYDYDPTADCPEFLSAIRSTVPEAESFLQEFAGLALTTETKYEIAVWFQGPPGSGKSTIIGGLQAMLGSRVIDLGLAAIERSRFALAKLPGKTLAISTEQPALFMQAADVLNRIISGEVVTVERKYRDAVEIRPQAKLLWAMNDLPRVPDANNGLFRRVKVVKFPKLPFKPDTALKSRIALECAGILNWALAGLLRLIDRGEFAIPSCVSDATASFQRENDVPAVFVADCCLQGEGYRTGGQQLYEAYKTWCVLNGHKPQSSTTLAADWERLGFQRIRSDGRTFYRGVGLMSLVIKNVMAQT